MSNIYLHLIGRDPVSNQTYLPALPANDLFWNTTEEGTFNRLGCPRTIGSHPKEDVESLPEKTREESLKALAFILQKSDHFTQPEESKNPRVKAGSGLEPLSYNIVLRILRSLAEDWQVWFAALPETRETNTWRRYRPIPEEEAHQKLPGYLEEKIVSENEPKIILGKIVAEFEPIAEFQGELTVYEDLSVEIRGQRYSVPEEKPFVAVHIDDEAHYACYSEIPHIVANKAFLELMKTNGKAADALYSASLYDLYSYQPQSSETCYFDEESFAQEYHFEISLLVNNQKALASTLDAQSSKLRQAGRKILASLLPRLQDDLRQGTAKVHIKAITLNRNGIQMEATLQTPSESHRVSIRNNTPTVTSKKRERTPATK